MKARLGSPLPAEAGLALEQARRLVHEYFTDPRDGQIYRSIKIGGHVWMAQNLNFQIVDSWHYENDESNAKKYGRLYSWDAAVNACPVGWRLPDKDDWVDLLRAAGGQADAGKRLKSNTDWVNGTDEFGFSAIPGGCRISGGSFKSIGKAGFWWSSAEAQELGSAYRSCMYNICDRAEYMDINDKSCGFSVRCVRT